MYLYKTATWPKQPIKSISSVAFLHRFHCIWRELRKQYKPRSDAEEWSESSLFSCHLTIFKHISKGWKYTCLGWLGEAKVSSISIHWGVQLRLVYSWAMPAILAAKGRGGILLFLLFLHCHSFSSFYPVPLFHCLYYLFSLLPFSGRQHKMIHKGLRVVKLLTQSNWLVQS